MSPSGESRPWRMDGCRSAIVRASMARGDPARGGRLRPVAGRLAGRHGLLAFRAASALRGAADVGARAGGCAAPSCESGASARSSVAPCGLGGRRVDLAARAVGLVARTLGRGSRWAGLLALGLSARPGRAPLGCARGVAHPGRHAGRPACEPRRGLRGDRGRRDGRRGHGDHRAQRAAATSPRRLRFILRALRRAPAHDRARRRKMHAPTSSPWRILPDHGDEEEGQAGEEREESP